VKKAGFKPRTLGAKRSAMTPMNAKEPNLRKSFSYAKSPRRFLSVEALDCKALSFSAILSVFEKQERLKILSFVSGSDPLWYCALLWQGKVSRLHGQAVGVFFAAFIADSAAFRCSYESDCDYKGCVSLYTPAPFIAKSCVAKLLLRSLRV
jgi:hypothetical protein